MSEWYVKKLWPDALNIRYEGVCHCTSHCPMWSFQLPDDLNVERQDNEYEQCGFLCIQCGWSNAGARPVEDDEVQS